MISPAERALRRRQAAGLVGTALLVLAFSAMRAGWRAIFLPRWWSAW